MATSAITAPPRVLPTGARRPWIQAALCMLASGVFFCLGYGFAGWVTARRSYVPALVFGWERQIPFVGWSIVPYWSLDLLYCLSFFLCANSCELRQHAKRLFSAQLLCVTGFLLFPLRFTFERPHVDGLFGRMFDVLGAFDGPFNQAPSLHLSLAVTVGAMYCAHSRGLARELLRAWFVLIGASALIAYQHHFIDVPTGVLVGLFCCAMFRLDVAPRTLPANRSISVAAGWFAAAALSIALIAMAGGWTWFLLWPAASCLVVCLIYLVGDPALFRKRAGAFPAAAGWLLAPYFAFAWVNSRWWTRRQTPAVEIAPGIWLGRVPSRRERDALGIRSIVDMSAEMRVNTAGVEYRGVPVLDLATPSRAQIEHALAAIGELAEYRPTLICCALGYSRSASAAAAWLTASHHVESVQAAIASIEQSAAARGRRIALNIARCAALREWATGRSLKAW